MDLRAPAWRQLDAVGDPAGLIRFRLFEKKLGAGFSRALLLFDAFTDSFDLPHIRPLSASG